MVDGGDNVQWDFFVSHTDTDRAWAEWIAWTLEGAGFRVLIQAWDSVPGGNWSALVQAGVCEAGRLVPVLSPAYVRSTGGAAVWQAVWASDPVGRDRRVVPVLVDECDRSALGLLGMRDSIDLRDLSEAEARSRLLTGMRASIEGRMKPSDPVLFPGSGAGDSPTFPGAPSSEPADRSGRTEAKPCPDPDTASDTDELRRLGAENPGAPDGPGNWPGYDGLAPRVLVVAGRLTATSGEPPEFRSLLLDICHYFYRRGLYGESHDLADRTHRRWQRTLGPDHTDTLTAAHHLARALFAQNKDYRRRVYELDLDILERRRWTLPADHPHILSSANSIAVDLRVLDRFEEACEWSADTWERRRRVLGDDHPDTLSSAANLAGCQYLLGEHSESLRLNEDVWKRRRRVLGDHHPDTLMSVFNIAEDWYALDMRTAARRITEKTLERCREILGRDHPWTWMIADRLQRWSEQ